MIDYGKQRSTVKFNNVVIDDYSVWVYDNIKPVSENVGKDNEFIGFEFNMKQYSKNEYIYLQNSKTKSLEERINNTQLALCEIYESLGGAV